MTYIFSLTPRMLTVSLVCAGLLCVLLFLLGFQIGSRLAEPPLQSSGVAAAPPMSVAADSDAAPSKADPRE